jgi:hypothetical protein
MNGSKPVVLVVPTPPGLVDDNAPNGVSTSVGGTKKRKISVITDRDEAMRRVSAGEMKRPAPGSGRSNTTVFLPPPQQADGSTPADRAVQRARKSTDHMMLELYNVIMHFVVLSKQLQQSQTVSVLGEAAADLARTGQY